MNILFFYRVYPNYGGVEVVTSVLARRFVHDGHHVTIASLEQLHPEIKEQNIDGVELISLHYPMLSKDNIVKLHKTLTQNKIDILINQWGLPFNSTRLCRKAIKGTKCRLVSVLHGAPNTSKVIIKAKDKVKNAKNFLSRGFYQAVLFFKEEVIKASIRYNVEHNERYIMLSDSFIPSLINYADLKTTKKIISIGNPITIPIDLTGFDLSEKKKQVLYVGRMDFENKRVNRIVGVWEDISSRYIDWELVLVGDGPHKQKLMDYVTRNKIERVRFEGFQIESPVKYYKEASIFMLTSDLEGFGLVITESMSFGCVPIVYGSYEAVYDIIDDGVCGFITPVPYSKGKTIERLEWLITHNDERKNMAASAMKKAQQFTLDSIVKKWYEVLEDVCHR